MTPPPDKPVVPRFGRLFAVCLVALVFCGFLVWLMGERFYDRCDLSWLQRFIH